ncbi:uncharacterized protein LOC119734073 [Patiria miniata]|uniref:Uncharacterized protein n=1 Tax=Patiria miniata TaxID=46514 RepID=A0A914AI87_PATMI|nr:uncharacterized protein LOC119734073 [Patiria miniata]XP_038063364.1 uncharacterized protein LOC119734073 [Patiria miniata]
MEEASVESCSEGVPCTEDYIQVSTVNGNEEISMDIRTVKEEVWSNVYHHGKIMFISQVVYSRDVHYVQDGIMSFMKSSTTNPHVFCQLPVCFPTASLCMPVFEHGSGKYADSVADKMKWCQPFCYRSVSNIQPYVIQDEVTL